MDLPDNCSPEVAWHTPPLLPNKKDTRGPHKKDRETPDHPLALRRGSGALPTTKPKTQRPELTLMGSANAIKPLSRCKKSPWRNKSTPPGPRGLHPVGALKPTHQGLEYETPSRQELPRAESRQNLRESAHTLPEARGLLSGTIKRGPLSKNQKNRLDLVNIEAKRQPPANPHLIRGRLDHPAHLEQHPGTTKVGSA